MSFARTSGSFTSVLVGVDGRQGGREAIALAQLLATPGAKLTLALVRRDGLFPPTAADEALEADLDTPGYEEQRALLERERSQAAVDAELVQVTARSVAEGLHRLAATRRADLLVVGSCHRRKPQRLLLGNDAEAVLDEAPCPVAIAPRGYVRSPTPPRQLGVGYDGSAESERALAAACDLAGRYQATLRVLEIVTPQGVSSGLGSLARGEALEEELARCKHAMARLSGVDGEAVIGFPDEELLKLSHDVDLFVIGSHRQGRLERFTHESVSRYLAGHAHCPLLIVPASPVPAPDGTSQSARSSSPA